MAPGPALSALLATLNPTHYNGWQLVDLLGAHHRQVAFEQSRMLAVARELAFTPRGGPRQPPLRRPDQDPYVGTEIGFALALTEHSAGLLARLAVGITDRFPALGAALASGVLDLAKVRLIHTELRDADDTHGRVVIDALLPEAARLTTTQIRRRLRRLLLTLDPDAARQRHTRAVESRTVEHFEYANGTAMVSGSHLPKDKAAAACQHVDAIAAATKAAGDTRELSQIRADVFVDLLAGVDPRLAGAAMPAPRKGVINLQIGLTTLAGLDDYPGEIAGFGPLIADIARRTAAEMATVARWRFTVRDADNSPVAEGVIPRSLVQQLAHNTATRPATGSRPEDSGRYRPTAAQRAFIHARDVTCRAPGCARPAHRCDVDHIDDWADTHTTTITNLCSLCERHHRAKHVGGYRLQRNGRGIRWTTPRGHAYTVIPDYARLPTAAELDSDVHSGSHRRGRYLGRRWRPGDSEAHPAMRNLRR